MDQKTKQCLLDICQILKAVSTEFFWEGHRDKSRELDAMINKLEVTLNES